jgi:hypothetical protein
MSRGFGLSEECGIAPLTVAPGEPVGCQSADRGSGAHEDALAVLGDDQALTAKFLDGLADSHPSYAEVLDKLTLGRKLLARCQSAELDPFTEQPGDLAIRWTIVRPINFSEV